MKKMLLKIVKLITLNILLLTISCDAPRQNPLDPQNPDSQLGDISGVTQTLHLPHQNLSGVEIYWANSGKITYSDQQGNFVINSLPKKDGWLFFKHESYIDDSLWINWNKKSSSYLKYLNIRPTIEALSFYSIIINRTPTYQQLELVAKCKISDVDNDVDSVFISCRELEFKKHLIYNSDAEQYERNHISMSELGVGSAEGVIGKEFEILVLDKYQHLVSVKRANIIRVIRDEIEALSPSGHTVVDKTPSLLWKPFFPGYDFTIDVQIFNRDAPDVVVWIKDNLAASTTSVNVDAELEAASYFWVLWCIDQFGNRSRSMAKNFKVE